MRIGMAQRLRIAYKADMVSDLEEKMYVFTYIHTSQIYLYKCRHLIILWLLRKTLYFAIVVQ